MNTYGLVAYSSSDDNSDNDVCEKEKVLPASCKPRSTLQRVVNAAPVLNTSSEKVDNISIKLCVQRESTSHTEKSQTHSKPVISHSVVGFADYNNAETSMSKADKSSTALDKHRETVDLISDSDEALSSDSEGSDSVAETNSDKDSPKYKVSAKSPSRRPFDGPKVRGELSVYDLPPIENLTISIKEGEELQPVGTVSSIIDCLVILQGAKTSCPLNEDTVVFDENRQPVGKIFEVFGTVSNPYYSIRFNSKDHALSFNMEVGRIFYYAPAVVDETITKYVSLVDLQRHQYDDGSWRHDLEVPKQFADYSDDEAERASKSRKRRVKSDNSTSGDTVDETGTRPNNFGQRQQWDQPEDDWPEIRFDRLGKPPPRNPRPAGPPPQHPYTAGHQPLGFLPRPAQGLNAPPFHGAPPHHVRPYRQAQPLNRDPGHCGVIPSYHRGPPPHSAGYEGSPRFRHPNQPPPMNWFAPRSGPWSSSDNQFYK